ncbi:GldG family protein [Leptospira stimsonii]|uniref:Gliding motility ABC transporter n=1 Tax=Leptospira stimsonii TaxID=2202203 RepID=A0ABY2MUS2_9LEPT|nr:GldG family protein [Leptospira stimsonii]TGK25283.1 gliding motility ABC transporter [Leptospira stimsonii]TGM08702.1 gliding motility ABC transporter [Leptospira stimsonii]
MISKIRDLFLKFNSNSVFLFSQIFLIFLFANGILGHFACRKDLSVSGRFEISKSTKNIFKNLNQTLIIDAYYSTQIPGEYKTSLDLTKELLNEMSDLGGSNVILRFHDPDVSEEDRKKAIESGISPQILEKNERGSSQIKQAYMGITLSLGALKETIPVAFFAEQIEYQVLTTLRKMIRNPGESGIALVQVPGVLSTDPPGPATGKDSVGVLVHQVLKEEYGPITEILLNEEELSEEIHTLLWIGSGTLTEKGAYQLDQFLLRGGSLILFAKSMDFRLETPNREEGIGMSPNNAGIARPNGEIEELNSIFSSYGFRVNKDIVLDLEHSLPIGPLMEIEPGVIGRFPYPAWILAGKKEKLLSEENPFTAPLENLLIPWSSSVSLDPERQPNVKMQPILFSGEESEVRSEIVALGEKQIFATAPRPSGKKQIIGALLEGSFDSRYPNPPNPRDGRTFFSKTQIGKTSRILVIGSPYVVSDLLVFPETRDIYQESNIPFLLNSLDISSGDTDLIQIRSKKSAVLKLNPFSEREKFVLSFLNLLGIPFILCLYTFLRIRHRNSYRGEEETK